jgi:hypothetical protein
MEMISSGRYTYHLTDISEIKAKPKPLSPMDAMRLEQMLREVGEYEMANNIPSTQQESASATPKGLNAGIVPKGQTCKHGHADFCGFCATGA